MRVQVSHNLLGKSASFFQFAHLLFHIYSQELFSITSLQNSKMPMQTGRYSQKLDS